MDDPTSCLPVFSKAGVGGGGEECQSMLSKGSARPARGKNGTGIMLTCWQTRKKIAEMEGLVFTVIFFFF